MVSFIPKHVWAVRANDSSASVWPIHEIIYCTCWSKFLSKFGLEKPFANAFKAKLCIIIIIMQIVFALLLFSIIIHMLLSILTILLCYIFLITCILRDFYLIVSIFARQYYAQALTGLCVFIFIHNLKKFRIGFTLRATSPFLFLERGQKERRVVHSVSMSQANVIVSE